MKTIKTVVLAASLLPMVLFGQNEGLRHRAGVSGELGFSNLFMGRNLFSSDMARPLLGGGGGAALFYELQYKHLLVRTGFGFDMTGNRNRMTVPEYTGKIQEYPAMTWHYDFDRYTEHTNYGAGYIPVLIGGDFDRWFFLAGVKLGVCRWGSTQPVTQATIWADDPDVIEPMKDLYTHYLTDYTLRGAKTKADLSPFNLMGSLEAGLNLKGNGKDDWTGRLRYRVSLFADYGFSNLLAKHTADKELLTFNGVSDITPQSIYDYTGNKGAVLNNFLIGVKFAVAFELPGGTARSVKEPEPPVVALVSDKQTGAPLGHSKVTFKSLEDNKNKKSAKGRKKDNGMTEYTDSVSGGATFVLSVGKYRVSASHKGYKTKRIKFTHRNRPDTVRIALTNKQQTQAQDNQPPVLRSQAVDALTGRSVNARITILDENSQVVAETTLDSVNTVASAVIDEEKDYTVCASAEGYIDTCVQVADAEELQVVQMQPRRIRKFVLKNMFFATDKTQILGTSEAALMELYRLLSDNPDVRIRIIGHTDDVGTVEYNQRLSEGRSASVKHEMVARGIDASRIETAGHGELDPIVANDSDEHRQMNRRVEIEILDGGSVDMQVSNEQLGK